MDDTKLIAHMPGFDIEISRVPVDLEEETFQIRLNTKPSLVFFGRILTDPTALPRLAAALPPLAVCVPLGAWVAFWRMAWRPWLGSLPPPPWDIGR